MGLGGKKVKQRIGNDPRNLSWADDAARFGMNYLAKFGWDSSKGLGASGEGMKSHLKASQKLDMLGIGAAHQLDPNGIAWKQNKDFERLLERLNGDAVEGTVVGGFKMADDGGEVDGVGKETLDLKDDGKQKKRKRKHDIEEPKKRKKKNGKEDGDGTKDDPRDDESINLSSEKEPAIPTPRKTVPSVPRHRAHRARAIAAKNLSSKSAAHIAEILGIAPTPTSLSTIAASSGLSSGADTPQDFSNPLEMEKLTTSTKCVDDYFKEKLRTKKLSKSDNHSASTPTECDASSCDTPRGGLGSSSRMVFETSQAVSRLLIASISCSQTEVAVEPQSLQESAATSHTGDKVKKKKKSKGKGTDEQDKWTGEKADARVSEEEAKSLREVRKKKTVDVGECQLKGPLNPESKSKKSKSKELRHQEKRQQGNRD